jgi:hypothetical protein
MMSRVLCDEKDRVTKEVMGTDLWVLTVALIVIGLRQLLPVMATTLAAGFLIVKQDLAASTRGRLIETLPHRMSCTYVKS